MNRTALTCRFSSRIGRLVISISFARLRCPAMPRERSDFDGSGIIVLNLLPLRQPSAKTQQEITRQWPARSDSIPGTIAFKERKFAMPNQNQKTTVTIEEPAGRLGVMLVGLGAVSTTFIAGVEAIKRGIAEPIGSLTQMGTIRLGKRTDNRTPTIRDFVPLASINDLVFGAWDIFEDDAYEAALHAGVLERELVNQLKTELQSVKPMKAVFDQRYVKRLN